DVLGGRGACRFGVAARERVEDAPVRVERCVCSLVRLEPLLARCAEHVPHDREHRGEELVLGGVADDLVEARVLFRVRLAGGDPALLGGEYFAQLGELRIADARRGERSKRGLDQTAELDDGQFGPPHGWSGGLTRTRKRLRRFARTVKGSFRGYYPAPVRALIFDLDGTLVDTVYGHVFAWQRALAEAGLPIEGWKVHRRIGMSGGLFTRAVAREVGRA